MHVPNRSFPLPNPRRSHLVVSLGLVLAAAAAAGALAGNPRHNPSSAAAVTTSTAAQLAKLGGADNPPDGGFEQANTFWSESSSTGSDVVCTGGCGANGQRAGNWFAWLGGVAGPEAATVSQTVTVGAADRFLTFWTWLEDCDSDGANLDGFSVSFDDTTLFALDETSPRCTEPGHQRTVVDISAFAGGTYELVFEFSGFGPAITNIYLDDVQILETLEPDKPADGGFEAGSPNPAWTEASTNFGTPLCSDNCGYPGQRSGNWWAWFGGSTNFEVGRLSQHVVLAAQDTTLSFWLRLNSCDHDPTDTDDFRIEVDGALLFAVDESSEFCDDQHYRRYLVDISAYADGGSHELVFTSTTHGPGLTNFFLDDVQILASLEAYYPFDVDATDQSPNARHATLEGAAAIGEGVFGGGGLDLTGGDGWADIAEPVLDDRAECTLAYLIRFNSLAPGSPGSCCNAIFAEDNFASGALHNNLVLAATPDVIGWGIAGNATLNIPAPTSAPTDWMHLAMTYNQSTGESAVYVNGSHAGSMTAPQKKLCGSGRASSIGAWDNNGTMARFLDASIDEMWIYSRVLSAQEIRELAPKGIFSDGFETGNASAWSTSVGN